MVQPAHSISPFDFSPPAVAPAEFEAHARTGEGPANRVLAELTLMLQADTAADHGDKWSMPASLRLIFVTCGVFWLAAGVLAYTFG
jgi:hypothetical protein